VVVSGAVLGPSPGVALGVPVVGDPVGVPVGDAVPLGRPDEMSDGVGVDSSVVPPVGVCDGVGVGVFDGVSLLRWNSVVPVSLDPPV